MLDRFKTGEPAVVLRDIPNHATALAGLDLYVSSDGGKAWTKRSDLTDFMPEKDCRNPAFGVMAGGTLAVGLVKFDHRKTPREFYSYFTRSTDEDFTWEKPQLLHIPSRMDKVGPYGKIIQQPDETSLMSVYVWRNDGERTKNSIYILRSTDSGRSWGNDLHIAAGNYNETAVLQLNNYLMFFLKN